MLINTIQNSTYNLKEREQLSNEYMDAKRKLQEMHIRLDEIEDEDEWEKAYAETRKFAYDVQHAYLRAYAAQFHKCKNEWFAKAIESFPIDGQSHIISAKQLYCFQKYASDTDDNSWRDGSSFCRVGNKLVKLEKLRYSRKGCGTIQIYIL